MEMEMNESPMKEIENYSDESTITSGSSGDSGGSFSPPLKRVRKVTSTTATATADADAADDTDNKISSTRSSISEEFGGPHLLQPSDILLQTAVGEEIGKTRTILEELANKYIWEECNDFWRTVENRPRVDSQTEIESWCVDPSRLYCYADQALEYVKKMKGEEYIYLGPRSMCLCSSPDSEYKMTHLNFFAMHLDEKLESLMFAALEHGPVRKVVECCSVPLFKAGDGVVPCVKHPPHVDCSECSKFGDAALCFEVKEEPCCISWSDPIWSSVV